VALLGKYLVNPRWAGYFIAEARQKIDFALSRTGVVLKSEARITMPPARHEEPINKPRHFYFDRPFLIYVTKRAVNAEPFFVMWVDNAELMQPYDAPTRSGSSDAERQLTSMIPRPEGPTPPEGQRRDDLRLAAAASDTSSATIPKKIVKKIVLWRHIERDRQT